jgi:hypothetical protein
MLCLAKKLGSGHCSVLPRSGFGLNIYTPDLNSMGVQAAAWEWMIRRKDWLPCDIFETDRSTG